MLVPFNIDVPIYRRPRANFVILGLMVLFFIGMVFGDRGVVRALILNGWAPLGLIGHMWLHVSLGHLLGNMIFLWTFGNAICAKVGDLAYVGLYLLLGLAAAVTHNLFSADPAVGASGAINGIVGMCLVLYPVSDLKMFYWIFVRAGSFRIRAFWMIGLWFVFDIYGVTTGTGGVGYWAHIGGLLAGVAIALLLLKLGVIRMVEYELSILDVLGRSAAPELQTAEDVSAAGNHHPVIAPAAAPRPQVAATRHTAVEPGPRAPSLPKTPPVAPRTAPVAPAPISLTCPQCHKKMQAPPSFSGRMVDCPACAETLQIP